ncbi:MAG: hypothetical protein ACFFC7_18630 [Candidatus Hermodarchaeota archaeon]
MATKNQTSEEMITINQKALGLIRAMRPQFLFAYTIFSIGGLAIGIGQQQTALGFEFAIFSILTVLIGAIGVHFRDEAADWISGYDKEYGGMGVIREGTFKPRTLSILGRIIDVIAIGFGILHASFYVIVYKNPMLFLIGIPMAFVIIFANYLTEEIPLGHELVTGSTYWGTILWVYLGQGWPLTLSAFLFSIFGYVMVLAIIPYQDIGDYEVDKASGKRTLTAKIGLEAVGGVSILLALIAMLILSAVFLTWNNPLIFDITLP